MNSLLSVIYKPDIFFKDEIKNANIVAPLACILAIFLITGYFSLMVVTPNYFKSDDATMIQTLSEKTGQDPDVLRNQILDRLTFSKIIFPISAVFSIGMHLLFYTFLIYILFNLLGYQATISENFKLVAYASVIYYIGSLILMPFTYINNNPYFTFSPMMFFPNETNIYLSSILKSINFLQIIFFIYLAIGVTKINQKESYHTAGFSFFIIWFLIFAVKSVSFLIGAKFGFSL